MIIPTLTTPRLVLRGLRASDWDAFTAMNADPRVRDWLGGTLLTRDEAWQRMESALGQWALRGYGAFAVDYNGRFAGRVGILHPIDTPEPELAWTLVVDAWGQGLATEAAACVRQWAFDTFGWDRLVSFIVPANARSRRVAEKLGAAQQGQTLHRDILHDVWVHPGPSRGVMV